MSTETKVSESSASLDVKDRKGTMQTDDDKYVQLREFSRVDATLPMEIRVVPVEERRNLRSRTSIESAITELQALPEVEDRALSECLRIINAKLDTIINMVTVQSREGGTLRLSPVNISAGGLRIVLHNEYCVGDVLEIRMMFPTLPYAIFYIYGDVVRTENTEDGKIKTSIEFTVIEEDIRDKIAKFVFEKQREVLRKIRRQ